MTANKIQNFLEGNVFAVVGASQDRHKYGNKVLRAYLQHGYQVYPVNPNETEVEGQPCFAHLRDLPTPVHGISIITPPEVTEEIVREAIAGGIANIWMQPGAESARAISDAEKAGIKVIAGGPCHLVVLGFHERADRQ